MTKPAEWFEGLAIGTIEAVAPDALSVLLDVEAPQATALNTGTPMPFPRLNGYVLVPGQAGAVVGQIAWLGVERSAFPKRPGLKDFGLIDLPYPLRKMRLTPIGTLTRAPGSQGETKLERGIAAFPSVGDSVILPSSDALQAIVQATGNDCRVEIGRSPLSRGAKITVDPDKLFGRHVAVLGNTGSGKSCTVAGLVRWSLAAALEHSAQDPKRRTANARFIILDPNGEYRDTFKDLGASVRVFTVAHDAQPNSGGHSERLVVPAWMWNAQEWYTFAGASPKTQQPMLLQALHELRSGKTVTIAAEERAVRACSHLRAAIQARLNSGDYVSQNYGKLAGCHDLLRKLAEDVAQHAENCTDASMQQALQAAIDGAHGVLDSRSRKDEKTGRTYLDAMTSGDLESVVANLNAVLALRPGAIADPTVHSPDAPIPFEVDQLPSHLDLLAQLEQNNAASQFIAFLNVRVRTLLSDGRIRGVIDPETAPAVAEWLAMFLGDSTTTRGTIRVIDFSLVPSDVVHIVVAAVARLVFEALQRYRRIFGDELPTVLVVEEAHSFIQTGADDPSEVPTPTQLCRRTFERIAREGRKFGVGLVLSSQRPAELSQTVLSQCNTFILHRIVNDRDQDHVRRLVPDLLQELLGELPSLPSQHAFLLGWASPIPKLVRINDLPPAQRPRSEDPRFWDVWSGTERRTLDWGKVAKEWTSDSDAGVADPTEGDDPGSSLGDDENNDDEL